MGEDGRAAEGEHEGEEREQVNVGLQARDGDVLGITSCLQSSISRNRQRRNTKTVAKDAEKRRRRELEEAYNR